MNENDPLYAVNYMFACQRHDGEGGRMSECGIFHFYVGRISLSDTALCKVCKGKNNKNC